MTHQPLLECIEVETGSNPTHAVIWLHGLGADGNDFAPIVPELRLPAGRSVRFVFPHAPVQPVTINGGMAMRSWYDILVPNLVRMEDDRGIPSANIVLAGFSQGCAMTLHTGLRATEKLAGLMALSGYLPLADLAATERNPANASTPIFLAHGLYDPVVTIDRAQASLDRLKALGYQVEWHTYPMPHSVCPQEIQDISAFLSKVLA